MKRNTDTIVRLSALLYQQSPMPSSPALLPIAYVVIPVRIVESPRMPGYGAVDRTSEDTALARIAASSPPPNFVINEGSRLCAFWCLKEMLPVPDQPIDESKPGPWRDKPEARCQRLLWSLAQRLGGDRRALDPRQVTFQIPGTAMADIFPRREVTVVVNDAERRYGVEEL